MMADETTLPAKPGTACLGCRRRKLKCSREQAGCSNCLKADLPCVYPTPETGVKRKRGPYRKDKAPRERHLEDLVKYLEPKAGEANTSSSLNERQSFNGTPSNTTYSFRPSTFDDTLQESRTNSAQQKAPQQQSGNSEDLVKDALIALTKSSVNDIETTADHGKITSETARQTLSLDAGLPGSHPSARRLFEYWDLFVQRFDPLTKIIHCPSFTKCLFAAVDEPKQLDKHLETLLFSIYFCAVSTCTAKESRARFGESRTALMQRYSKTIEADLSDNYSMPSFESLQGLVLYLRTDSDINVRALFSLAVRMAQMIKLDEDPTRRHSFFEVEMRRRLWWHLCGLESRAAEEGVARHTSIMEDRNVRIPSNLNDVDLQPGMKEASAPRTGVTETSFIILRFEVYSLAHRLWTIKKRFKHDERGEETTLIQREQRAALDAFKSRMNGDIIPACDTSRRYDWLIVIFYEAMSVKMRIIVEHPTSQVPTKEMSKEARLDLLQSSVTVIGYTLGLSKSEKLGEWEWCFRGYMQWHAVAVVIAELGRSTNVAFANNAWAVLDPILRTWDETYKQKRDEPSWDHVNALIAKAREMRRKTLDSHQQSIRAHSAAHDTASPVPQRSASTPQPAPAYQPPPASASWSTSTTTTALPQFTLLAPNTTSFLPNFNAMLQNAQHVPPPSTCQIPPPPTGCAPTMPGFEEDFGLGDFDSLENIDFSAFDAVFGDTTWESSPSMEFSWEGGVT